MAALEICSRLKRVVAEAVLSLMVLEAKLRDRASIPSSGCSKVNSNSQA